jgi:hypothetical protein
MAIFALLAAATAVAAPLPEPIAQADAGQAQCYTPNIAAKTCASLSTYRRRADGGIDNIASVLLTNSPVLIMTTVQDVTANIGRVCGALSGADIATARFTLSGADVGEAKAAGLRAQLTRVFAEILDHMVCTTYVPDGSGFVAHITFDGVPRPGLDQRVIWVTPADGWKVAPPPTSSSPAVP